MRRNDRTGESSAVDMHGGYLLLFAGDHWAGFVLDTIFVKEEQSTFAFADLVRHYSNCVTGTCCVPKGYLFNFPCDVKRQTPTNHHSFGSFMRRMRAQVKQSCSRGAQPRMVI
jgi:hypothetical protein